ncbi:DUF58 domain-containing protein [Poseidonocella sedimentorum]|uniref:DUF58 domain-containing protein n=1 Tax=Poseidonocella sedimentorum TaxID=871652 RepID=A0A1I6E3U0_9RHOB|nr:DUF58 domain-containing protein [Poseidonocella sedimentorum]SFR12356.1 Protein of unknown function DUF58 [Poseidonocella sedimentorum]
MAARQGIDLTAEALIALRGASASPLGAPNPGRSGARSGRRRGPGFDIHDLRPFVSGDDPRHIDPGASARSGRLQLRTFLEEVDHSALLIADFRASMLWGSRARLRSVAAAEALAVVGWQVVGAGGAVGLMILRDGGPEFHPPRARDAAMLRVAAALDAAHRAALNDAPPQEPLTLDRAMHGAARLIRPGTTVILATGLDDPGRGLEPALGRLARRADLMLLAVTDPLQADPPALDLPFADPGGRVLWGRLPAARPGGADLFDRIGAQVVDVRTDQPFHLPKGGTMRAPEPAR